MTGAPEVRAAFEATWPAAAKRAAGPFLLREGAGGGKRVSAATALGPATGEDIAQAEAAMREAGMAPLFRLGAEEDALDAQLAERGYEIIDPTILMLTEVAALTGHVPPRLSAIEVFPPLAIMAEVWAAGGVGPARLDVMARASDPKVSFLGRHQDRAVAAAFASASGGIAFVHAVEVLASYRRMGVARNIMAAAAHWAQRQGIGRIGVAVTRANQPARALYASMGFHPVEEYHYRIKPGDTEAR